MGRSDAGPPSAEVVELESLLDRPDEGEPREAVGLEHAAAVWGLAVACGIAWPQPRPAWAGELVVRLDEDPGPESRREAAVAQGEVQQAASRPLGEPDHGRLRRPRPQLKLVTDAPHVGGYVRQSCHQRYLGRLRFMFAGDPFTWASHHSGSRAFPVRMTGGPTGSGTSSLRSRRPSSKAASPSSVI